MTMPANHRQSERALIALVGDGQWEIDSEGRVWRVARRTGLKDGGSHVVRVTRRRAEKSLRSGYLMVRAMLGGRRVSGLAHRLVWQAVHGNIPDGLVINHRNGRKSDNRPENLELSTYADNARHAHRVLGVSPQHGQHNPMAKLTPSDVADIRAARSRGERASIIAERFGIRYQTVHRICNGERWGHLASPADLRVREMPERP